MTFDTLALRLFDLGLGFMLGSLLFWGALHHDEVIGAVLAAEAENTPISFHVSCASGAEGEVICRKDHPIAEGE